MKRNNSPYRVVVLNEGLEHARLKKNSKEFIEDMPENTYEVFEATTNKPFNLWDDPTPESFYVVIKRKGGLVEHITPPYVLRDHVNNAVLTEPRDAVPQVVVIKDVSSMCNTEYTLKIQFNNARTMNLCGDNFFDKIYTVTAPCCSACESCSMTDPNALLFAMYKAIKVDRESPIHVDLIDESDATIITKTSNEEIFKEIDAWVKSKENTADPKSPTERLKIKLVAKPLEEISSTVFGSRYLHLRNSWMKVTLISDDDVCKWGHIDAALSTPPVFEEGSGYDIRYKEYFSAGYENPDMVYRIAEDSPMDSPSYRALLDEKYYQFVLNYDIESTAGWHERVNPVTTIVAFKKVTGTAMDSFKLLCLEIIKKVGK